MIGATPMMISSTFASSPNPATMNSMGKIASGGISETAAMKGASVART